MGHMILPSIPMKKQSVPALALAVLLLGACAPSAPGPDDTAGAESSVQTIDPAGSEPGMVASSSVAPAAAVVPSSKAAITPPAPGGSRTIAMTVTNFTFEPAQITVKRGEKITLQVTGVEGTHGLAIPDLGVNVSVAPGQTVTIEIPTTKAGTFAFFCSIPCGSGHRDMRGSIVITE